MGQAQVDQLHPIAGGQHDVLRLDIEMHDAELVKMFESCRRPPHNPHGLIERQRRPFGQRELQVGAVHELKEQPPIGRLDETHHIGVLQHRTDPLLSLESPSRLFVSGKRRSQSLRSDPAAGDQIATSEDLRDAALAQHLVEQHLKPIIDQQRGGSRLFERGSRHRNAQTDRSPPHPADEVKSSPVLSVL